MALTDLPTVRAFLRLPAAGTAQDTLLSTVLIPAADKAIKNYCKRPLETAAYTEYLSGNDTQRLPLREYPVINQTLTGTLTSGSPTVTGLTSTSTLLAGLAVSGTGIPGVSGSTAPTVISSVDSSTQVTLSTNATANGAQSLTFGTAVYLDMKGYYGKALGAFALPTLLIEGLDHVLEYAPDGSCRSGNLIRLSGGIGGSAAFGFWPMWFRQGSLTAQMPPAWPKGVGNCKAVYVAGLGVGPADGIGGVPDDLTYAANALVKWMRQDAMHGGPLRTDDLAAFQAQAQRQAAAAVGAAPELGQVRQILSRHRRVSI